MFTGIVEGMARVCEVLQREGGCLRFTVELDREAPDIRVGSSVSISGVCLTVIEARGKHLTFEVMRETLSKTNLSGLREGMAVNYERSLRLGDEVAGHLVLGHVDCTGVVESVEILGDGSRKMWVRIPVELAVYVAPKGSIAVDGVSLTVVDKQGDLFSVSLIPHTLRVTTLGSRRAGELVNIEFDVMARYVVEAVKHWGLSHPRPDIPEDRGAAG